MKGELDIQAMGQYVSPSVDGWLVLDNGMKVTIRSLQEANSYLKSLSSKDSVKVTTYVGAYYNNAGRLAAELTGPTIPAPKDITALVSQTAALAKKLNSEGQAFLDRETQKIKVLQAQARQAEKDRKSNLDSFVKKLAPGYKVYISQ